MANNYSKGIWLHVEGKNTPQFDSNGYVTGLDNTGSMINDMRSFLNFAQSKNILVIFALWNGAYIENDNFLNLMWDESKLQSYIDNALKVFFCNHSLLLATDKFKPSLTAHGHSTGRAPGSGGLGDHERTRGLRPQRPGQHQQLLQHQCARQHWSRLDGKVDPYAKV